LRAALRAAKQSHPVDASDCFGGCAASQ